jgi:hypothetical protein
MPSFRVTPSDLLVAGALLSGVGDNVDTAGITVSRAHSALANTPAAGAFEALLDSVQKTSGTVTQGSRALAAALTQAGNSYQATEDSATTGLSKGHK